MNTCVSSRDQSGKAPTNACLIGSVACDFADLGAFPDRSGLVGEVRVLKCRLCGIGASWPALPNVAFLYADRTSPDFQPGNGAIARLVKSIAFRAQARRLMRDVPTKEITRVIDFGCGSGLFTRCLASILPGAEVIGVDFHDTPPTQLSSVGYRSAASVEDLARSADLVLGMHVLEHDDDPRALLDQISEMLHPGGHLVVETPNIECIWADVFGKHWDAWYLPYHRVHFNRKTLRALVEAGGFTVVRELDVSVPSMGRAMANLCGRRNGLPFILLSAILQPVQWMLERVTAKPVAIRVVARKR